MASRVLRREMLTENFRYMLAQMLLNFIDVFGQVRRKQETETRPGQIRFVKAIRVEFVQALLSFFDLAVCSNEAYVS